MKLRLLAGMLLLFSIIAIAGPAHAQTYQGPHSDTFTFAGLAGNATCSDILSWDGVTDAYPEDMGAICLNQGDPGGGFGSFVDVPFQLGYLNNGYLAGCNAITFGPKVFSIGDGTHTGDAFSISGSTTCPGYTGEWGNYLDSNNRLDGFNVTANYTVAKRTSCYRGRCTTFYTNTLQGGTGVVTDSTIN